MARYPEAKGRYLKNLPPGESFYVATVLFDRRRRFEQVFVLVDRIDDGMITGRIANEIEMVAGYKRGNVHRFPERDVVDWMITKPDGSEEGNFVGKFLESLPQAPR